MKRMTGERLAVLKKTNPDLVVRVTTGYVTPNGAQHKRNGKRGKEERIERAQARLAAKGRSS